MIKRKDIKGLDDILPIIVDMSMSSLVEKIKVQQSLYDISLNRVTRSEDEGEEMEGYTKVDDLNSFKWMLKMPQKDVYIEFIKRGVKVEPYYDFDGKDFCHNFWGCIVSAGIHALDKYKDKGCKEVFFIDGEFYTKNNVIDFNYEDYCKGGYVVTTRGGLDVNQIKKLDVSGVFPVVGVINGQMIQTWTEGGSMSPFNHENEGDLVMYKV